MNFLAFDKRLKERAQQLNYQERLAHSIAICKRLFPYYKAFVHASGFGNPDVLLDSIRFVEAGEQDKERLDDLLDRLEEVCPDTEDYEEAEYALNACEAVNALLLQVAEPEESAHFVEVALSYYDTLDTKVHDENDEGLPDEVLEKHPLLSEARRFLLEA